MTTFRVCGTGACRLALSLVAAGVLNLPATARADGAFPGEMNMLLPPAALNRLMVGTNFGLMLSEDSGAHWYYVCEQAVAPGGGNVQLYALGQGDVVFAVAVSAFSRSSDAGHTWKEATGTIAGLTIRDAFADPNDDSHVFVIAATSTGASAVYPSDDGGLTFTAPVLVGGAAQVASVEVAQSPANLMYATTYQSLSSSMSTGAIARSTDLGVTWTTSPVTILPNILTRIAAVDPGDGNTLYLRLTDAGTGFDSLGISTDGGATVVDALDLGAVMGGFAKTDDGTLYVGGAAGGLWVRAPNATTFTMVMTQAIPCLGARGNTLYACGDGIGANFALGSSVNGGQSFTPIFYLSDVIGPIPCAPTDMTCAAPWQSLTSVFPFIGAQQSDGGPYLSCGTTTATMPPPATSDKAKPKACSCGEASDAGTLLGLGGVLMRRRRRGRG